MLCLSILELEVRTTIVAIPEYMVHVGTALIVLIIMHLPGLNDRIRLFCVGFYGSPVALAGHEFAKYYTTDRLFSLLLFVAMVGGFVLLYFLANAIAADLRKPIYPRLEEIPRQ